MAWPIILRAAESQTEGEIVVEEESQNKELFWGEFYSESVARQIEKYNLISDTFIKQGIHAFNIQHSNLDLYVKGRLFIDCDQYYWNNRSEIGLGSRYKPIPDLGLILFFEFLYARYTGRDNEDDPNPDDSPYMDLQGGLAFWNWWGKQTWQLQSATEVYAPFSGWRELYGDCIYYHDTDRDVILTLDYKEGLLLGKLGRISFDGYLTMELSCDRKSFEWYNYISAGMGIRIKPFEKMDLTMGLEYLWDYYYGGGFDEIGKHNSGLLFQLEFWHGW
jgi:hypothetical protein